MGKTKKYTLLKAIFCYSLRNFVKLNFIVVFTIYIHILYIVCIYLDLKPQKLY